MQTSMKRCLFIFLQLALSLTGYAQSGSWVWLKGDNGTGFKWHYGTMGISSPANEPPARKLACYWTDLEGNFWVFGSDDFNDLWKYNPVINEWTWVKGPQLFSNPAGIFGTMGVPGPLNNPPITGFGANCWTDESGDLWLYSGSFLILPSVSVPNDVLWRYHIATNEWTWMKGDYAMTRLPSYGPKGIAGSSYTPGARRYCQSGWVLDRKLWLFGGATVGGDNGFSYKNDLWSFDIASNSWAWESGTNRDNDPGNFGTMGIPSGTNVPPARASYTKWKDASGNFYLFGGNVTDTSYNDVWQYNIHTGLWTWISGTSAINDPGSSVSFCSPSATAVPSSRSWHSSAQSASQCNQAFWHFGGSSKEHTFNDLWLFNTITLEWTKVKEGSGSPASSSYGTKGIPDISNQIPGRSGSCLWTDHTGSLYVFGGNSFNYIPNNDLWKFIPDSTCFKTSLIGRPKLSRPSDTLLCGSDTLRMKLPLNCTVEVEPGSGMRINPAQNEVTFWGEGTTRYTIIAKSLYPDHSCFKSDTLSFTIKHFPASVTGFSIIPAYASIRNPVFNFLNQSTGAIAYEWYYEGKLIATDLDLVYSFPRIGEHCLTLVSINHCGQRDSVTKCCYVSDTTRLQSITDTTICPGDTLILNLPHATTVTISPSVAFTLDTLNHILKLFPDSTTHYVVTTKATTSVDLGLPSDTAFINITVPPLPEAAFIITPPWRYIDNTQFEFLNKSVNAVLYEWYYEHKLISSEKDVIRQFPDFGQYCLTLVASNLCGQKDTATDCCAVYIKGKFAMPNAFTPNGDGKNDLLKALAFSPLQKFRLLIVNRYGQEIFSSENVNEGWDGRFNNQDQEVGVYYYLIKLQFDYPDAQEEIYKGDIILIR